jgi:hypothetical protein
MKFFVRVNNEIEKLAVLLKFEAWGIRWGSGNEKATDFTAFYVPTGILYNYFNKKEIHYGMENGIPGANILDFLKAEKIEDVLPFEVKEDCVNYTGRNFNCCLHGMEERNCHQCPDYEKKKKAVRKHLQSERGTGSLSWEIVELVNYSFVKVCPGTHRIYIDCEVAE